MISNEEFIEHLCHASWEYVVPKGLQKGGMRSYNHKVWSYVVGHLQKVPSMLHFM